MARHRARRRKGLRISLISISSLLVLAVAGVAGYAFSLSSTFDSRETLEDVFPEEVHRPPEPETAAQNILLLGSDTRQSIGGSLAESRGLTDVIMVAHIPADRSGIQVMSIMRDSWVEIPGHGEAKINSALSKGGMPLVVQTVESLIQSRIDHVAIVDFNGFKHITNALGGVDIDVPVAYRARPYNNAYVEAGTHHMNGDEALAFVRERYSYRDGDYQRARNQQIFIKSVLAETLTVETLSNPVTISNLVGAIAPHLATDEGLDSGYVASLGFELRNVRVDDVDFFTMPTAGIGTERGQSIVLVDWTELEEVRAAFKNDTLGEYEYKVQTI